jgi:glycosyltransferase involved in cell wall biosynthesis
MPIAQSVLQAAGKTDSSTARRVQLVRSSTQNSNDLGAIDFSVVIPAHNRPEQLAACLDAIATSQYPLTRCEVIVVDDGSEENLEPVVVPFLDRMRITLLRQPNSGPAAARNAGAIAASGRYVVFTDDDCRPDAGWLTALAGRLATNPECAAGGKTLNGLPGNLFSTAGQLLLEYLYRHWNRDADDVFFIASNNLALPRVRFLELGGFDTNFPLAAAEDRELCDRWRSQAGRLLYAPDALVNHFHALTLKTFLIQHFNYGRGAKIFHDVRRQRAERFAAMPKGSFYLPLAKFAFTRDRSPRGFLVAILVGFSQIIMPLGYLRQMFSSRSASAALSTPNRSRTTKPTRSAREIA